jgi:flagellar motility protein MotE (MotC chaperone)
MNLKEKPKAVLMDAESCQSLIDAIGMSKIISQGENDIEKKQLFAQESVFKDLQALFKD